MRAAVYSSPGDSVDALLTAFAGGLGRHGIAVSRFRSEVDQKSDFIVSWGWRAASRVKREGYAGPILVMERGYLGDRLGTWTSLGWDGLNGRARFPVVSDGGERFRRHFSHMLSEWNRSGDYALLVGQVRGDQALGDMDIGRWYVETASKLRALGYEVLFRQHPRELERNFEPIKLAGIRSSTQPLGVDLSGARIAVTFNSNTGCNAILAGVPVHADDEGSMVWKLASHDYLPIYPDREPRLAELAWCQWTTDELRSGAAWSVVATAM